MSDFEAWIGTCHIQDAESSEEHSLEGFAAVWANSRDGFEAILQNHLTPQSQKLVWAEETLPISEWLQKHGHNTAVMGLAKTVHEHHLVELGTLTAVGDDGEPAPPPEYLTITEHEIPPLPAQDGVPFWDKEWIAPELKELLFGQPKKGARLRTYFIVDATLRKNITGFFDLDKLDVPIQCLFKGEKAEELKESAPYLIDMTLPDGAWDDKDLVPSFHKNFFDKHWGQNTGMFIRTSALFADVWGHFRKFPRIQVEEDKRWVYFRFWDPRIAPSYFYSIKTIPEKIAAWVDMRGTVRVERLIGNQTDSTDAWTISPEWGKLEGFASIGMPMLSNAEMNGFEEYKLNKFDRETAAELLTAYPDMNCDALQFQEFSKIVQTWAHDYKIVGEKNIKDLGHAAVLLGASFPKDIRFKDLTHDALNSDHDENTRVVNCLNASSQWIQYIWDGETFEAVEMRLFQCISHPLEDYDDGKVISQLSEYLNPNYVNNVDNTLLNTFIQDCSTICESHNITSNYQRICYVLFAFIYGAYFMGDPIRQEMAKCFKNTKTDIELQNALNTLLTKQDEEKIA